MPPGFAFYMHSRRPHPFNLVLKLLQQFRTTLDGFPECPIYTARSAWLRTSKLLEDVDQLQGESKRLAEQVSLGILSK
ncbi:MAG: hypothetical protein Q9222_003484 [Ikaeria aurantiellina]